MTDSLLTRPLPPLPPRPPALSNAWGSYSTTLRIGDAERHELCEQLSVHYALGRIDAEELDERITRAMVARTVFDLRALVGDLPATTTSSAIGQAAPVPTPPHPQPSRAGGFAQMAGDSLFALVTVGAILCTVLLLLAVTATSYGSVIWLGAFGAAVSACGVTYFAVRRP